ncbi:hypothetical protein [Leptolyngbya sp. NIES-2104]|nr:hypothetical protein [Leptolyngbya sp. NIES-2104]GAP94185.1 hypothetical protein NIES2104_06960 [Leptolyngbya sp. NIES-2104]
MTEFVVSGIVRGDVAIVISSRSLHLAQAYSFKEKPRRSPRLI